MPLPSRPQLVLLEIAAGAALVAVAFRSFWFPIGIGVAAVCAVLALVPVRRRGLYRVVQSWLGMRSRRSTLRGHGVASMSEGGSWVVTVPSAGRGAAVGAIRDATTWSVPLDLPLTRVFNDDPPIDLDRVATLLTVEGVPLASVRLVTVTAPAPIAAGAPPGPVAPSSRHATRHLVLTLDTAYAADVIAERGGEPAIHQILRRCVLRAEEVLAAAGVDVRRLPESAVAADSYHSLGPVARVPDEAMAPARETLGHVEILDWIAMTFAVTGTDALARLSELAESLPVPVVATSVVLQPGPVRREAVMTVLVRLSGPADVVRAAEAPLVAASQHLGVRVDRVYGEQLPLLKATTLLGVAVGSAA